MSLFIVIIMGFYNKATLLILGFVQCEKSIDRSKVSVLELKKTVININ